MREFLSELWDEFDDFIGDLFDHLLKRRPKEPYQKKTDFIYGTLTSIRPAYLFAERVDNLLRILFGVSILISGVTASLSGFSSLSDLLKFLISTFYGRGVMLIIGLSYLAI